MDLFYLLFEEKKVISLCCLQTVFGLLNLMRHGTLLNQSMRRQLLETRHMNKHSRQSRHSQTSFISFAVEFTKCVAVVIPFNGEFATFCSLGQT